MQVTTTQPLFGATLRPDRSLRSAGGWISYALAIIVGTPFLIAVPEFLVPGVAAYGLAGGGLVALGLRQARLKRQFQRVTLWPEQIEITTAAPGQNQSLRRLDPAMTRLRLERDEFERTTGIFLVQGQDRVEIGAFLSSDDKSSFAKAFGAALRRARKAA